MVHLRNFREKKEWNSDNFCSLGPPKPEADKIVWLLGLSFCATEKLGQERDRRQKEKMHLREQNHIYKNILAVWHLVWMCLFCCSHDIVDVNHANRYE